MQWGIRGERLRDYVRMLDVFGRLLDLPTVESAGRSGFFKSRFFIDSECERCLALFFLATSGLAGSASLNHETYLKTPRLSLLALYLLTRLQATVI